MGWAPWTRSPLGHVPSFTARRALPGSSEQGESHGTALRSGQEGPGPLATGPALTIFTGWALPVVAAGSEGHRTLIRDLCVRLVWDELPPAPVVGRDHVVVNLLEESEGGWGGERPAWGQPGGAPQTPRGLTVWQAAKSSYYQKSCGGNSPQRIESTNKTVL